MTLLETNNFIILFYLTIQVIGFLKHYGIEDHYKVNIEPNHTTLAGHEFEHDIMISSAFGMLGSIDANAGDTLCGWYQIFFYIVA